MNRGSSRIRIADSFYLVRFNEAPIHESGKSYQASSTVP